ncbi:tyrosinase family protein [Acinetobacter seifertii]|uniref:tyrosinase family protein n=1 Tax=Acinetobacter seifertii TaxID=1530123 RepID=UPI001F06EB53|nr:tyrosinase family protein [Acinetobacter seifertii]MCH2001091.1 tyrosinase family protein [Acinetobacter seifertii]
MKRNYYILGTLLCGMSLATHADSLRMSATEFAKDPAKVSALQKGLEKMRANNNANPLSPEFRTSFNYWANTHGYFGTGTHGTDKTTYLKNRMAGCLQDNSQALCDSYYKHIQNSTVPKDGFTDEVWGTCQHGNLNFLPWHRMMLYFYERTVRKYVGQDYSLPYWDYYQEKAANGKGLALPQLVRGKQAGSLYDQFRSPGLNENISAIDPDDASAAQAFKWNDFTSFSNQLQSQPHGVMHCAVGKNCVLPDMGFVPIAGLDPVFYMHHANIDRLWQCWLNKKANGQPITLEWAKKNLGMPDSWYNTRYTFADENGNKVTMTIADVFTPGKIPVRYTNENACKVQAPVMSSQAGKVNLFKKAHKPVSSNKTIKLMGVSQKVALAPQTTTFLKSASQLSQTTLSSGQTYLILDNVQMVGNPNLTYKIYLSPKNKPDQKIYVATINYFGVLDHSHGGHASNGAMGQLVYQVSDQVNQLGVPAEDLEVQFVATDLTLNPVKQKVSSQGLSISQVRLETSK